MEDYWNEICILREARLLEEYLDELDDENNQAKSCEEGNIIYLMHIIHF